MSLIVTPSRSTMAEEYRLSRELSEAEVPDYRDEDFEEARIVHRKPPRLEGLAGGSEEKAGIEPRPPTPLTLGERRLPEPPPSQAGS
jgi:hypothetical protein